MRIEEMEEQKAKLDAWIDLCASVQEKLEAKEWIRKRERLRRKTGKETMGGGIDGKETYKKNHTRRTTREGISKSGKNPPKPAKQAEGREKRS